jgi:hypothetical protein
MLGSTFTVTLDGSGGTVKTLPLINQDGYGAEYYLDDTLVTYRTKVRHSKDNVKAGTQPFDRHTVTMSRFTKPTEALPHGTQSEVTFTIRNEPNAVQAEIID